MDFGYVPGLVDRRRPATTERKFSLAPLPAQQPVVAAPFAVLEGFTHTMEPEDESLVSPILVKVGLAVFTAMLIIIVGAWLVPAIHAATPIWLKVLLPLLAAAYVVQRDRVDGFVLSLRERMR